MFLPILVANKHVSPYHVPIKYEIQQYAENNSYNPYAQNHLWASMGLECKPAQHLVGTWQLSFVLFTDMQTESIC